MGQRARCYGHSCEATRAFRLPDAAAPMGFNYNNMADTTNATYDGGIEVPHECLSGAKIGINPETSKHFSIFFKMLQKTKGRRP